MKKLNFLWMVALGISSPVFAGVPEEMNKAMKQYGDDARKIMEEAEGALKEGIPYVEDYFRNPGEIKTPARGYPQESFFGFGEKRTPPEPVVDPAKRCQSCRSQSVESLGKASDKPEKTDLSPQKDKNSHGNPGKKDNAAKTSFAFRTPSSRELIVFVSLGMPDAALKQLALEAEKTKARLVIRGLIDNSFKTTMTRLQELKIPVEIDPTLFDLFEVKRVPTFIRCKMSPEGAVKENHDRLTGNIFIRDALEKFKQWGELT